MVGVAWVCIGWWAGALNVFNVLSTYKYSYASRPNIYMILEEEGVNPLCRVRHSPPPH